MIELFYSESIYFTNWDLVENGMYKGVYNVRYFSAAPFNKWTNVPSQAYKYAFKGVNTIKVLEIV